MFGIVQNFQELCFTFFRIIAIVFSLLAMIWSTSGFVVSFQNMLAFL